jgi:FdhD protein
MQRLKTTQVAEWTAGNAQPRADELAIEEPLEIRVGGVAVSVTMRTPGDDFELASGFLFTERIVEGRDDIAEVTYALGSDGRVSSNVVDVTLQAGKTVDLARLKRHFYAASSCGVCGKSSICAVRVAGLRRPSGTLHVDPEVLCRLPDVARAHQAVFDRTGGLHAAALFDAAGTLLATREDIGRHNAVDKVVGYALLERRLPLSEYILFVSGRGAFEIIQKALVAGLPVVASVSAPSSLAVELAREHGLTLIGFLRGRRFVVYSGHERLGACSDVLTHAQQSPRSTSAADENAHDGVA